MAARELVVSFEINGVSKGSRGTPARGTNVYTTTSGSVYGEIKDYVSPGSVTSSPGGVQNM